MNKYDIYWAEVAFQEKDGEKTRPALVIGSLGDTVSVLKITSQGKSPEYQYKIIEWETAGLSKPSYVDFSPIIKIPRNKVGNKMGKLQLLDVFRLEQAIINRL